MGCLPILVSYPGLGFYSSSSSREKSSLLLTQEETWWYCCGSTPPPRLSLSPPPRHTAVPGDIICLSAPPASTQALAELTSAQVTAVRRCHDIYL